MANIIFDFDGTIADSLPIVVSMINNWMPKRGPINNEELQELRNLPIHKVLERLEIGPWRAPQLLIQGRLEMSRHIDEIPVVAGIPEAIEEIHKAGHAMYIMSSNSPKNIRYFLKKHGLHDYFKRVYGGVGIFGKASALRKVLGGNRLNSDHTYYVGDEVRDIHAAHKAKVKVVAVTWGYNGAKILASERPTEIANKPADLINLLSK